MRQWNWPQKKNVKPFFSRENAFLLLTNEAISFVHHVTMLYFVQFLDFIFIHMSQFQRVPAKIDKIINLYKIIFFKVKESFYYLDKCIEHAIFFSFERKSILYFFIWQKIGSKKFQSLVQLVMCTLGFSLY